MASSSLTPSGLVPELSVWGGYQRFRFSNPLAKVQAYNEFKPTSGVAVNNSVISIETKNNNLAGFRLKQITTASDSTKYGKFHFQYFVNDADDSGTDIFSFDDSILGSGSYSLNIFFPVFMNHALDLGSFKITNLASGSASTDAANIGNITSAISAIPTSITLTGNVTGSGSVGSSITTTIASTLDQIPLAVASLNMNTHQINNLAMAGSPASTDAVNVSYLNSQIAAGTIVLTGNVTGSGHVGTSFATTIASTLNQIPIPTGAVSMNSFKITSLASGSASTDAANIGNITSAISGSTVTLTGNVTGSGNVGSSIATTIVSKLNQIPVATGAVNLNSQNITSVGNIGIAVSSPTFPIQFSTAVNMCKICLSQIASDTYQVYGFGIEASGSGGELKYSVPTINDFHTFYCGTSSTSSAELFRIAAAGYATVSGGDGTFYSRVPCAQIYMQPNSTATSCTAAVPKKIAGVTTSGGYPVQFTTSSSNRITFNGSDISQPCIGMATASASFYTSSATAHEVGILIMKNGTTELLASVYCTTNTAASSTSPNHLCHPPVQVSLSPTDYLELWVLSTSTENVTVSTMNLAFQAC